MFKLIGNKKGVLVLSVMLLSGCYNDPQEVTTTENDYHVGKLFTVDGCSVYRFKDAGNNIYFSNCRGEVDSSYKRASKHSKTIHTRVPTNVEEQP
ncbi:DUF4884 domain-containing protein [Rosenbergiella collisarenosi]|uniref:DUF4884 domain-containing protein n=1 Tax=Rosenbergiella collisarenosi TaxID=1544695 RepID=UPI001F4E1798|nr:DUF4884 domain-containing protein [Rosenbergiella collisarenosi]